MANREKCLIKDCAGSASTRGLCRNCYQVAVTAVRSGATTWPELVSMGLANSPKKNSGQQHPFNKAFTDAKAVANTVDKHTNAKGNQ